MISTEFLGIAADVLLLAIQSVFVLCCWVYLISGLDDLVIDLMWMGYKAFDRLSGRRRRSPTRGELLALPERPLAIMFPAWHEADVIGAAVANILATIEYSNFQVFIGTYPNDLDTQREADLLTARFHNVHKVVTSAPGPTCKADCLNHILAAIRAFEERTGTEFIGVVMQDAEDVVPPLALHVFNYYAREFDLVQVPVLSLPRRWWDLTGGHYMEEFAEFGAKEIYVREHFAGVVPGCGVGTYYSKRALSLAEETGETFSTRSLTEDYEFSFRMRDAGLKMHFARIFMTTRVPAQGWRRLLGRTRTVHELVATREFFPNKFRAAFRQKSRWTVGIALQGWRNFGWKAGWRVRYLFWRDRRGLVLAHVTVLGAVAFLAFLGLELFPLLDPSAGHPAPLLPADDWLWNVVWINLGLLAYRLFQRHLWACVHYGPRVLPMVTARYFWASVVNYCALVRALRLWARHLRTGKPIGWDKTAHVFPIGAPTAAAVAPKAAIPATVAPAPRHSLGDALLDTKLLDPPGLVQAEVRAAAEGRRLEEILLDGAMVGEAHLARAVAQHAGLPLHESNDPFSIAADLLQEFPLDLALRSRCVPVACTHVGGLVVATAIPPDADRVSALSQRLGRPVEVRIATREFVLRCLTRMTTQALWNSPKHGLVGVEAVPGATDTSAFPPPSEAGRQEQAS